MGDALHRIRNRRETLRRLRELDRRSENVLVIHYSCESFYDRPDGSTPRITSIAVRNLASGQTESFSIHKVAELRKIPIAEIRDHYDVLEKEMLDEFGEFLQLNHHCTWVHWNMRDINYGFQAIERRHKVLGGTPPQRLPEERKFDLARALISIYGVQYAGHPRTIARELVATVRKNVTIDWTIRDNVRAQLRVLVKRILRKYGYPPDKQEKATETVLEQAAVLSEAWSAA